MIKNQNYYLPNFITSKEYNKQETDKIIRTIKNKKIVYCHGNFQSTHNNNITPLKNNNKILENNLNKKDNENKNIELDEKSKNFNYNNNKTRGQRGSKYRRVSKNGNQWQVLIMINKKKDILEIIEMKKRQHRLMILLLFKIMEIRQRLIFIILLKKLKELKL